MPPSIVKLTHICTLDRSCPVREKCPARGDYIIKDENNEVAECNGRDGGDKCLYREEATVTITRKE
jgi:hypothetical protein